MMDTKANILIERIRNDMQRAMREQDRVALDELRSLLARIGSAEAVPVVDSISNSSSHITGAIEGVGKSEAIRKQLSDSDIILIINDEIAEIHESLDKLDPTNDYAVTLSKKREIITKYLTTP